MNDFPSRGRVKHIREMYPVGTRIELVRMYDDLYPLPAGSRGTVKYVSFWICNLFAIENGGGMWYNIGGWTDR